VFNVWVISTPENQRSEWGRGGNRLILSENGELGWGGCVAPEMRLISTMQPNVLPDPCKTILLLRASLFLTFIWAGGRYMHICRQFHYSTCYSF